MLLLALSCLRVGTLDVDVTGAVLRGDVQDALSIGLGRLDRVAGGDPHRLAALGHVLGQALLAAGRDEQAEELFQKQLRVYEGLSRSHVRWMSSMDRGFLFLHLNKPGRAAETFNVVADAADAPTPIRIEALAGLAMALQAVGEHRRAARTLAYAVWLAEPGEPVVRRLLDAIGLELHVVRALRNFDDVAEPVTDRATASNLRAAAAGFAGAPVVAHRLEFLAALVDPALGQTGGASAAFDELRWWRERRLTQVEERGRIEAALALIEQGNGRAASDILGPLGVDDTRQQHHRHAIELRYCASKLHAMQGRHADALRCYRQHAQQVLARVRAELMRVPYSRFLEQQERAEQSDADQLRLPLRYRKAYQFILDHLNEKTLSVRRIAAQIDVTERALQMAFRSHLGLTPAEVIRRLRMACIRTELQHLSGRESVLSVATRWGMGNRSTLAQNYRQQFGETPTATSADVNWHDDGDDVDVRDLVADEA